MGKRKKKKIISHRQPIKIDYYFSDFFKGRQRCTISAQLLLTNSPTFRCIFTIGKVHQVFSGLIYLFNRKGNTYRSSTESIYFGLIQSDEFLFWLAIATTTFYYILEQPSRMFTRGEVMDKVRIVRGFFAIKQLFHKKLSTCLLRTIFQNSGRHVQALPANYHRQQNNFFAKLIVGMEGNNKTAGAIFRGVGRQGS